MLHGAAGLLLAAAGGYWVLERANSHRGQLKRAGQLLGTVIIAVALAGVVCRIWYVSTGKMGYYGCEKGAKAWYCPYAAKAAEPTKSSK
jgi:hypothetical protein